jgi:hypothetical protein
MIEKYAAGYFSTATHLAQTIAHLIHKIRQLLCDIAFIYRVKGSLSAGVLL